MMNTRKLIKQLRKEAKIASPNNLSIVKSKLNIPNNNKLSSFYKQNLIRILAPCSCACAVVLIATLAISSQVSLKKLQAIESELNDVTYISLSLDPVVELKITNQTLKTSSVRALNKDGAIIVYDEDVTGSTLDESLAELIHVIDSCGYIDEAEELTIQTIAIDEETKSSINEKIQETIDTYFQQNQIDHVALSFPEISNSVLKKANKYNVSPSKYLLIQEIMAQQNYSLEALINKSVSELNDLYFQVDMCELHSYLESLDDKYSSYVRSNIEENENIAKMVELYGLACNIIGTTDKYLLEHYDIHSTLPPKIDFFKEQFDWINFIRDHNSPCKDTVEMTLPSEHPTFEQIQQLVTTFFNKNDELNAVMKINDYFIGYNYMTLTDEINSLTLCKDKFIGYVNFSFRSYLSNYIENAFHDDWQIDFKRGEIKK